MHLQREVAAAHSVQVVEADREVGTETRLVLSENALGVVEHERVERDLQSLLPAGQREAGLGRDHLERPGRAPGAAAVHHHPAFHLLTVGTERGT